MQWCQVEDTVAGALAADAPVLYHRKDGVLSMLSADDYRRMARTAIRAIHGLQLAGLIERCPDD